MWKRGHSVMPDFGRGSTGRYFVDDAGDGAWEPCRVSELTIDGAIVEILGTAPRLMVPLHVELERTTEERAGLVLTGRVRNVEHSHGRLRLGVQWTDVDGGERAALDVILARRDEHEHDASEHVDPGVLADL